MAFQAASLSAFPFVSRETSERLEIYCRELLKWNARINLVSRATEEAVWTRHITDSVQIYALQEGESKHWVDFGSGAGLPGMVVAILASDLQPNLKITLVESDQRKCAFLMHISRILDLSVDVKPVRIEDLPPQSASIMSARALAPLPKLLKFVDMHGRPDSICLFHKGASFRSEIAAAKKNWSFSHIEHQSRTDPDAVILRIEGVKRAQ